MYTVKKSEWLFSSRSQHNIFITVFKFTEIFSQSHQLLNSYSISFDYGTKSNNNDNSLSSLLLRFEKELGIRHFCAEKIIKQIDYLKTEPNDSRMRAAVLVQLLLPFEELADISDQHLKLICDEYNYQLRMYEKYLNNSKLMEQRLLYIFKVLSIQLKIMSGEFYDAINDYFELSSEKLPIKNLSTNNINNFILVLYNISYDIIQVALILDEPRLAHNIKVRATSWIKTARDHYRPYNQDAYNRTQHILELDSFLTLLPSDVKDYYEGVYEYGVDSFSPVFFPNKIVIENDTLTIQNVKTINNISEKIAKAKNLL